MKELLLQLARYNLWANQLIITTIQNLAGEVQQAKVKSSYDTLARTLLHMLDAESIWWQRIKLQERVFIPSESHSGVFAQVASDLTDQNKQWVQWVQQSQEHMLLHEFIFYNSKKEKFKQATYQVLFHLFNHGTYHRGQLVTILRQFGVTKIPQTDFIVWTRKK